jgi:uncharacterized protein YecT (DUF1311 family)
MSIQPRKSALVQVIICLSLLPAIAGADCEYSTSVQELIGCECADAQNTLELNRCLESAYTKVDVELNRVYQKVMKSLSHAESDFDKEFNDARKAALRQSQRAWISFRDGNVNWIYTENRQGSIRNQYALYEKIYLTLARINKLKRHLQMVFVDEITADRLVGEWHHLHESGQMLHFTTDGKFSRTADGKVVETGTYEVNTAFLIVQATNGQTILDQRIHLENRITGLWEDEYALEFVDDTLASYEVFIRVEAGQLQKGSLTLEALKNMTYIISEDTVKLTDGEYREKVFPDAATEEIIRLSDAIAFGDLDGNAGEDAAVLFFHSPGGSGTFYYLAAVINDAGSPNNVATVALGDRIRTDSLSITNREIVIKMMTHAEGQGLAEPPAVEVTRRYRLVGGALVEVTE